MKNKNVFPGADESTPSLSQYFSWINNTNEGATEAQSLTNLAFFEWMHNEYGMQLDIYAFDAGAIDGSNFYGSTKSERFKRQFPNGFEPMVKAAARFGCRLGIWGGPDGFGDTPEEAHERIEMMVSLCRDHNFILFKFDSVCGDLRKEKIKYFIEMMEKCRKYSPDLILLNHRLELGKGLPHASTFLWEGREMYSDINISNQIPGTHNRIEELNRGLPPNLQRLTEDHGVCISSCLDHWEDSLILQAFNRSLILSPEIYGSPWLLSDEEFPRLARIYNLHKRYKNILVKAVMLPEKQYGKNTVSRGDGKTRFITLKNLNWDTQTVELSLNKTLGLNKSENIRVSRMHPFEKIIGDFKWNQKVTIEVEPFRTCLLMIGSAENEEIGFRGCDGEIIKDKIGENAHLKLWGLPGTEATVKLETNKYENAHLDGKNVSGILKDNGVKIKFPGKKILQAWHRKCGKLKKTSTPIDASALYEATCFSTDNNAAEVRSLQRSGETQFEAVKNARNAFFEQDTFKKRGLWDKNCFDNDPNTFFSITRRFRELRVKGGAFRLDFGKSIYIDQLTIEVGGDYNLQPLKNHEAVDCLVSNDLKTWVPIKGMIEGDIHFNININKPIRYFKLRKGPERINEIRGFYKGKKLTRSDWKASNLFAYNFNATATWKCKIKLDEIHKGSYLVIPIFGKHIPECIYAAAKCGKTLIGASHRAPSYPSNTFENLIRPGNNYSYFIPLKKEFANKEIEIYLLGDDKYSGSTISSEVWITAYPSPHVARNLILS